jgi:hypothetical protein
MFLNGTTGEKIVKEVVKIDDLISGNDLMRVLLDGRVAYV